jgi:hypothetical protein
MQDACKSVNNLYSLARLGTLGRDTYVYSQENESEKSGEWSDMKVEMINTQLDVSKELGYVGKVAFCVEGHKHNYEITLQSKDKKKWGYSLYFLTESGDENQLNEVDETIDEDDNLFQQFVDAVLAVDQATT